MQRPETQFGLGALSRPTAKRRSTTGAKAPVEIGLSIRPKPARVSLIFPGLPRPIIGGQERQGVTCAAARWREVQVCGLPIHQSWPVADLQSCSPASRDAPTLLRLLQADGTGSGCRCVVVCETRSDTPIHARLQTRKESFFGELENGCARGSAPETDWLSRADRRHSKPNECSLHVARVWASRRSGRAGKQSSRERESERANKRRGLHTTTGLVGLGWGSNGPQQTGHSRPCRARPLGWFAA